MKLPRGLIKRSLMPSAEACESVGMTDDDRRQLRNKLKARRKARRNPVPPQAHAAAT